MINISKNLNLTSPANEEQANNEQSGFILIAVLVILALSLVVGVSMLSSKQSEAKIQTAYNTQSRDYYRAEESMNRVLAWFQEQSPNLVSAFQFSNFGILFGTGFPTIGSNETSFSNVPSVIKLGSAPGNSVFFSNNPSFFGNSNFPVTTNISSGATVDTKASFALADFGGASVRALLVSSAASNLFRAPIFRIDIITGTDVNRGVRAYTYIHSAIGHDGSNVGIFVDGDIGFNTTKNTCVSNKFDSFVPPNWSVGHERHNCTVAAGGIITTSAKIKGTIASSTDDTVPGINYERDGESRFQCMGIGCHTETLLPIILGWSVTPPPGCLTATDSTISSDTSIGPGCKRDVTIAAGATLILDGKGEYQFRTLIFEDPVTSKIEFRLDPGEKLDISDPDFKIKAIVGSFNGNTFNTSQFLNTGNLPAKIQLEISGTSAITISGEENTEIRLDLKAPDTDLTLEGNFGFFGSIRARSLQVYDSVKIHVDEDIAPPTGDPDLVFWIDRAIQRL